MEQRQRNGLAWEAYVDGIAEVDALQVAKDAKVTYPLHQFRVVNQGTGEVTHIGADGKPLSTEAA